MPGATVKATNEATSAVREVQSNAEGTYRLAPLPAGSYTIEVSSDGFSTQVQNGLVLQVNQVARTDFTLQLGQVGTIIEVQATAPIVASENATVGQVIDNKKIIELPMNGREFLDLRPVRRQAWRSGVLGQRGDLPRLHQRLCCKLRADQLFKSTALTASRQPLAGQRLSRALI